MAKRRLVCIYPCYEGCLDQKLLTFDFCMNEACTTLKKVSRQTGLDSSLQCSYSVHQLSFSGTHHNLQSHDINVKARLSQGTALHRKEPSMHDLLDPSMIQTHLLFSLFRHQYDELVCLLILPPYHIHQFSLLCLQIHLVFPKLFQSPSLPEFLYQRTLHFLCHIHYQSRSFLQYQLLVVNEQV